MRANESCFDEFEFCKTLMKVLKLCWMFTIMETSLLRMHFAQLNADWRIWKYFRIIVWLFSSANDCVFSLNEMQKVYKTVIIMSRLYSRAMLDTRRASPAPELSFLPAPYRGWTRAGERRVQDNLHAHAQNEPIKNYWSQPRCLRQCVAQCLSQLALWKKTLSLTLILS